MCKAEKFQILIDREYRLHNRQYHEAVERLIDAADKEGYGKAALAWFEVTISCVDWHDYVRRSASAKARPLRPEGETSRRRFPAQWALFSREAMLARSRMPESIEPEAARIAK